MDLRRRSWAVFRASQLVRGVDLRAGPTHPGMFWRAPETQSRH